MKRNSGMTLPELMVTLCIAGILTAIAIPSFQNIIRNNQIAAHTNEFLSALNLARNEAIKRGVGWRVVICPSSTGTACAGTWGDGWMVFVDGTGNGDDNGTLDTAEFPANVLRVHEKLDGNDTLIGNVNVANYISFTSDGTTRLAASNTLQFGTLVFSLCSSTHKANTIVINNRGRARVEPVSCSS